jgi:hypothetical protein
MKAVSFFILLDAKQTAYSLSLLALANSTDCSFQCMFHYVVFWVMIPCSDVVEHQCFRRSCCLHLQGKLNGTGKGAIHITLKMNAAWSSTHWYPTPSLYGVITQKTTTWISEVLHQCMSHMKHRLELWNRWMTRTSFMWVYKLPKTDKWTNCLIQVRVTLWLGFCQ